MECEKKKRKKRKAKTCLEKRWRDTSHVRTTKRRCNGQVKGSTKNMLLEVKCRVLNLETRQVHFLPL